MRKTLLRGELVLAAVLPLLFACGTSSCGASSQSAPPSTTAGNAATASSAAAPKPADSDQDEDDEKAAAQASSSATGAAPPSLPSGERRLTFDGDAAGQPPSGFSFARTGQGGVGKWVVQADKDAPSGPNVLAQVDKDATDYRFPLAVTDGPADADLSLSVRCKPVSGSVDRACGLVFRYADEGNYYVTRANALENNVRLYHVVKGKRVQFAGWNGKVTSGEWHELRVDAKGDHFQVYWDQHQVIDASDKTFTAPGKVGLWTKADSVTYFDDLRIGPGPR